MSRQDDKIEAVQKTKGVLIEQNKLQHARGKKVFDLKTIEKLAKKMDYDKQW